MISRMRSRLTDDMLSACINIISINGPSFGTGMFSYRSKSSQHGYAPLQRKDGSRDLTKKRYNAIIYTTFMNRILILPINVKIAALKKLLQAGDDVMSSSGNHTIAIVKESEGYNTLKESFATVLSETIKQGHIIVNDFLLK